jgi:hypothetical protein
MTPFDLEAALKGAEVVTRAGRPAILMSREPGLESSLIWTDNTGAWFTDGHGRCGEGISENDVFMSVTREICNDSV